MRRHVLLCALLPIVILGCPSETPAVCDNGACDQSDGGNPESSPTGDAAPDGTVTPPDGCDPNADPKDAPKCVVSDFGIFVDATTGNDGNTGSKELPVKTIAGALAKLNGRPRIYVCEGTYPESVKLTSPVSVFGGFACGAWTYSGVQPKVAPGVAGAEAFLIDNVKSRIVISDMHADAAPGDATKKNSIAMRVVGSTDVSVVRVKASAGAGFKGDDGPSGTTGVVMPPDGGTPTPDGNPASGTSVGAAKTCTCSTGGTTTGGAGGVATAAGGGGAPNLGASPPSDGAGGTGNVDCAMGGYGHTGASAPGQPHAEATSLAGKLVDNTWVPSDGLDGATGTPGQGGGGGGGRNSSNAGGGGGCGGCGGTGGKAGRGGGASIAIVVIDSKASIAASSMTAANAGDGGKGGAPGVGGDGGIGGGSACSGGEGGKGGSGGAGSGGAGGISVGILWKGSVEPTRDDATNAATTVGAAGASGVGGVPGVNDGPVGKAEKVMGL